jgi:transposase
MARTRRTYTPEFKAEAVKLVTEQGYSVAEAARSLGISDNLLRNWKQALETQGEHAFPRPGETLPLRGGEPPPPGREQAAPGGA